MMEDYPLPPELEQLERHLAARERSQPPRALKQQVLHGMRADLRRLQARSRWTFAAAMAATVLVWLNLSLCASQATDYGLELDGRHQSLGNDAEQIQQLFPDLPPREAMRQAILLRAGAGVVGCPNVSAGHAAIPNNQWKQLLD